MLAVMTTNVDLPADLLEALEQEAERRGMTLDAVITECVGEHLRAQRPGRKLSFVGIGASNGGRSARDADEMLAEGFGRD